MPKQFNTEKSYEDDGSVWMNGQAWNERLVMEQTPRGPRPVQEERIFKTKEGEKKLWMNKHKPLTGKFIDSFDVSSKFYKDKNGNPVISYGIKIELPNGKRVCIKSKASRYISSFNACLFDPGDPIEVHRWSAGEKEVDWLIKKPGFVSAEDYDTPRIDAQTGQFVEDKGYPESWDEPTGFVGNPRSAQS